ncbi:MAG: hypothetical protein ACOCZ5_01120 [bacterium]
MKYNKKGVIELRIVIVGLITMLILNGVVGLLTPNYSLQDRQETLDELTDEMGVLSSTIVDTILALGSGLFSLFGVDFIASIDVLPTWFISFLVVYNVIVIFSFIMYLVDRFWFG